ncbi:MAG: GNAT family N-acetyltransferase [Pseudomonadales bacterium]|nr:GNAT family N-acetyltransferase [Pseudomonadales bacterium]
MDYYSTNREHLAKWEPNRDADFYTHKYWERWIGEVRESAEAGTTCHFVAFSPADDLERVAGVCNLTNISRGVFQACIMGYSIGAVYSGRGLMREIVSEVVTYAFNTLELHRVMANHMPENERSARVLADLGFQREGLAQSYLKIGGRWRDHILTAKINPRHL